MNIQDITIRSATIQDAEALLKIYAPYVEKTAVTFEYTVPSVQEFSNRILHTLNKYPYLVAEYEHEILGYTYASSFKERAAYDWAAETTIYIHENIKKMGAGRKLYETLETILSAQNISNLYACIAYPFVEDEYLTKNSVHFHQHLGYRLVGEFRYCGYKFHRWYHMVWMEKHIGEHLEKQPPIKTFDEVRKLL